MSDSKENRFHRRIDLIMSGEANRQLDSIARAGLWALSLGWRAAAAARSFFYDRRILSVLPPPLPVVSVGNITAGGTGKSPFVMWLADQLFAMGLKPAIVSRGYKPDSADGSNDEIRWMRRTLGDEAQVIASPDRYIGALSARKLGASSVILDDGFQHRQLGRQLDIVLIDATNPFGYANWLPRGLLREHPSGLKRADVIVVTRTDQVDEGWLKRTILQINALAPDVPIARAIHQPLELVRVGRDERLPLDWLTSHPIASACAIGNPRAFELTLRDLGSSIRLSKRYPDHYRYTADEIIQLMADARASGAEALIISEKDGVKFPADLPDFLPVYALEVAMEITDGESIILNAVKKAVESYPQPELPESAMRVDLADDVLINKTIALRTDIGVSVYDDRRSPPHVEPASERREPVKKPDDDDPLLFVKRRRGQ